MAVDVPTARLEAANPPVTEPAASSFSLDSLLIAIGWICVNLALGKVAIELALILAALSLPALARTSWLCAEYERSGKRPSAVEKSWLFLSSITAISAAIAAGASALVMICVVVVGGVITVVEITSSAFLYVLLISSF